MDAELQQLLEASRDASWQARSQAAVGLARFEGPEARQAMLRLLNDAADTGVTQAAMNALLERMDDYGVDVFLEGLATGDDETADHMLFFLGSDQQALERKGFFALVRQRLIGGSDLVPLGAADLLDDLGTERSIIDRRQRGA